MKIIILSSCYPKYSNINHGIFVHQQVKALQNLGVECHVIQSINWFPPFGLNNLHPYWKKGYYQLEDSFTAYEGVTIHHPRVFAKMPSRFFSDHHWDVEGEAVARYIKKNEKLWNADILYAQFLIHEGYVGTIVKQRTGIPLVSIALGDDVHAWPEKNPGLIPFLKQTLYKSDLLLANSNALARDTEKWADRDHPVTVQTMYQGIDLVKFKPLEEPDLRAEIRLQFGLDEPKHYLLCVATPVALKGWLNLLVSIQHLKHKFIDWQLLIVAPKRDAPDALDLEGEAEKRNIAGFVKYMGSVPHNRMPSLMQAVDAFVLPSHNEGLSNAVIEAMATGLPVIATDVGGHNEFISHRENGILIKPNNTNELIEALGKVVSTESYRSEIACNAREGAQLIGSYNDNAIKLKAAFESF